MKNMSLVLALSAMALSPFLAAQTPSEVCHRLQAVGLLSEQEPKEDALRTLALRWLEDVLHLLREPEPGGTYRWARLAETDARTDPKGVDVEDAVQTLSIQVKNWHGFRLYCPKKKNLFWGNAPVLVRKAVLSSGGAARVLLENHRLERGEDLDRKFGGIIPEGTLEVVFERVAGGERSAYVEVSGLLAGWVDDPGNPSAGLVKEVRGMIASGPGGYAFPGHLEKALEQCRRGVRRELEYILFLLNGTEREREDARRRLEALVRTL